MRACIRWTGIGKLASGKRSWTRCFWQDTFNGVVWALVLYESMVHEIFILCDRSKQASRELEISSPSIFYMHFVCPSITSNFSLKGLKFCLKTLLVNAKKVPHQIFKNFSRGWDMRVFLSWTWRTQHARSCGHETIWGVCECKISALWLQNWGKR